MIKYKYKKEISMLDKIIEDLEKDSQQFRVAHNITSEALLKYIKEYKKIVAPSIAILKEDEVLSQYGDITLVFDPKIIFGGKIKSLMSDRENYVYSGDMHSPRFPEISYDFVNKELEYYKMIQEYGEEYKVSIIDVAQSKPSYDKKDMIYFYSNNDAMKMYFINQHEEFSFKVKEDRESVNSPFKNDKELAKYLKTIKDYDNLDIEELKNQMNLAKEREIKRKIERTRNPREAIVKRLTEMCEREYESYFAEPLFENGVASAKHYELRCTIRDLRNPPKKVDKKHRERKINRKLRELGLEEDYRSFCEVLSDEAFVNPHFKLGTRRKLEVNAENALLVMKKEGAIASEKTLTESLSKTKSRTLRRLYDLEDVLDTAKQEIKNKREINEISENLNHLFHNMVDKIDELNKDKKNLDHFDLLEEMSLSLAVSLSTKEKVKNYFEAKKYKTNDEFLDMFLEYRKEFKSSPVNYFEAKLFRNLDITDVACVVLPRNAPQELKEMLKDSGVKTSYYAVRNKEDFERAMKKTDRYLLNDSFIEKEKNKIKKERDLKRRNNKKIK
tara:strand:- start:28861 stop:30534 length:1674 start_codon:yes stop_codon:yes gene_type:complete